MSEEAKLRDLLHRLLHELPHERNTMASGRCAGCGAVQWCGDGKGADPCKQDCVLQEALMAAKKLPEGKA